MSGMQGTIAIVGLSCRYPGASSVQEFWENILAQRTQFRAYPKQRLPIEHYVSSNPDAPDRSYLGRAGFLDNWLFDRIAWRIPQKTWDATDPAHWLALELADNALQQAGGKDRLPKHKTGVYVGNTLTGEFTRSRSMRLRWPYVGRTLARVLDEHDVPPLQQEALLKHFQQAYQAPFAPTTEDSLAGGLSNTIAGRICGHFDFRGGGYTVDGACSSSLLAVATAAERLASGEIDAALAGGVDISLDPFELVGFAKAGALCTNELRIYDERASGMIPGEGAGFIVMKRLEDARRDRDPILAIIKGWGISSDGKGAITAPKASGQAQAIATAWERAGYSAADLDFVEGHGTGTSLGDPTEIRGLALAQQQVGSHAKPSCGLTSLKSIVGHTKAAAGIGALVKAILCVNQRIIAPTAGCTRPHPVFSEVDSTLFPMQFGQLKEPTDTLRGGVSAMGFGGINAHVTVESAEPPSPSLRTSTSETLLLHSARSAEVLVASAASKEDLLHAISALRSRATGMADGELVDLSAETWHTPAQSHRFAVVAKNAADLLDKLDGTIAHITKQAPLPTDTFLGDNTDQPRIGVVFPGQGKQYPNMGRRTLSNPATNMSLEALFQAMEDTHRERLRQCLHPANHQLDHNALTTELTNTELAQPAIVWTAYAWWSWLQELGVQPEKVAGHSLGELVALYAAEAFDAHTLFQLAAQRGASMIGEGDGMTAFQCTAEEATSLLTAAHTQSDTPDDERYALIANKNGHMQTVVGGQIPALERIERIAQQRGVSYKRLPVTRAFHSGLMHDAAETMKHAPCPSEATLKRQWISSVHPTQSTNTVALRDYLAKQVTEPVDFTGVMEQFDDMDLILEVGPGRTLSRLFARHGGPLCLPVEGQFGADEETCRVLATLFSMNVPINTKALFQHRFTRPFVPASERVFLTNPCELYADGKAVTLPTASEPKNPENNELEPHETAPQHENAALDILLSVVEKQTGFPVSTLQPEHRLLDDLHLDSIKSGELIAHVAQALGCAGSIDPLQLANARLDEIAEELEKASSSTAENTTATSSWVASFQSVRIGTVPPARSLMETWSGREFALLGCASSISSEVEDYLGTLGCQLVRNSPRKLLCLPAEDFEGEQSLALLVDVAHRLEANDQLLILDPSPSPIQGSIPTRIDGVRSFASSLHLENPSQHIYIASVPLTAGRETLIDVLSTLDATRSFQYVENHDASATSTLEMRYLAEPEELLPMPEGVILATGGARGITAKCLVSLAREQGGTFALVGRSPLGEEARDTLQTLRDAGAIAAYFRADIGKQEDVARLVREVESDLGRISWIYHGAGVNKPRRASTVSEDDARWEVAPKLKGMQHLLGVIPGAQIQRITAFTSIIGEVGMPGNAWYGYANESLHRLLSLWQRKHSHAIVRCLGSSVWGDIGMGARMGSVEALQHRGIMAIEPNEGARLSYRWACAKEAPTQIFLTARLGQEALDTWKQPRPTYKGPMIQNIIEETPEVEGRFAYHLDASVDTYLQDHVFDGTILLPTVFAVEWMAQGVKRVLCDELGTFVLEDVRLSRPVVVDPETGSHVQLHVLRLDQTRFKCSIYSESTGFSIPHFEATALVHQAAHIEPLDVQLPEPGQAVSPQTELYGSLLFQGERFQRLQRIKTLGERRCSLEVDHGLTDEGPWFMRKASLLLGSPYMRDAMLQSGQLLIAPRQGLPVAVKRWVFHTQHQQEMDSLTSILLEDRDDDVVACVQRMDADGVVLESIEQYEVKVLHRDESLPTMDEMADVSLYLGRLLSQHISKASQSYDVSLPAIQVRYRPGIGTEEQAIRRMTAQELLDEALSWDDTGAPHLSSSKHVSIAHDGDILLATECHSPVGIDLIELREQDWNAMTASFVEEVYAQALQLDHPGAHIWAAREVLLKQTGETTDTLNLLKSTGQSALFSVENHRVLTQLFSFRGRDWIVGLSCLPPARAEVDNKEHPAETVSSTNHALQLYSLEDHLRGERGETIFRYRFPLAFDSVGNPSGGVHFSEIMHWLGHTREIGLRPSGLYKRAMQHITPGEYAWVTKETALSVMGQASADDLIEVDCWNERAYGPEDASLEMFYKWYSISRDGTRRPLAESCQTTTWARVLRHGVVQSAPYPDDMLPWLTESLPSYRQGEYSLPSAPSSDMGEQLWASEPGPEPGHFLAQETFRTTPRNANMVGNVYWANYFDWMGEVRDSWAQSFVPYGSGELRCVETGIQHLRETMPGEQVLVKMHLEERYEKGLLFSFTFFRREETGELHKLAKGTQTATWFAPDNAGTWHAASIPFGSLPLG